MEIKDKRLNIAETLKQATMALETHRAWMKRRVSSSITPLDGNEAVVVGDVTESNPKMVNVAWALGSGNKIKQRGDNELLEGSLTNGVPAPPPSDDAQQRGVTSQGTLPSPPPFAEETNNHERGSSSASPTAQGNFELLESPTTPFVHRGQSSPDTPMDRCETTAPEKAHFIFPSSSLTKHSSSKIKKRHRITKATIVPVDGKSEGQPVPNGPHHSDDVLESSRPISPDVFIGESFHSDRSPLPPASTLTAWGSHASLNSYSEPSKEQQPARPGSAKVKHSTPLKINAEQNQADITMESADLRLKVSSSSQYHSPVVGSPTVQSMSQSTSSSSREREGEDSFGSVSPAEHFEVLQRNSSARLIPVTPAPKEQRSSYALHTQSKLMAAEADTKIYQVQHKQSSSQQKLTDNEEMPSWHSLTSKTAPDIPDSVLQTVLPRQRESTRKIGLATVPNHNDDHIGVGEHVTQQSHQSLLGGGDTGHQRVPSGSPKPSMLHPLLKTSLKTSSESPSEERKHVSFNKANLTRSKSVPADRLLVHSWGDDVQQQEAATGSAEVFTMSHGSPRLKSKAVSNLNLPPLKNIIGIGYTVLI